MQKNVTQVNRIPFGYDVVGSLLRTDILRRAYQDYENQIIALAKLKQIQQKETRKIVKKQIKLGLKVVTDGEFNRSWWHLDFLWGLDGVSRYDYQQSYKFHKDHTRTDNVRLVSKIKFNPVHPFFEDFKFLNSLVPKGFIAKQTIPSPTLFFGDNRSDYWFEYYNNWEGYLSDLVEAYRKTILSFYDLGCRYIQLDDTTWAFLISKLNENEVNPIEKQKYEKIAQDSVWLINQILKGLPDDLTVTTHICRGNFKSTYLFEGGYDAVADYLGQLNYDGLFLEYDNDRSGSLEPIKKIWNNNINKQLILGLITTKTPELENVKMIEKKIQTASQYVPIENLGISTQCGFASTEEGNNLTEEEQWNKLSFVKYIARSIWPSVEE